MLFNSLEFLLFFAAFIAVWPLLRRRNNPRWIYLTIASLVFYGWWDWRFIFLIIGSGLLDYFAAMGMSRWPGRRGWLLTASILGNVGCLATFKYLDFGIANLNRVLGAAGMDYALPLAALPLPVGISFYTFQSMSYTIEVYRGQLKPTSNVFHFFAYLSLFPQLVAGPIVRATDLLPQLREARSPSEPQQWAGLKLVLFGYAKKVVIADNIGLVVQRAFMMTDPPESAALWWLVMVMFAFQIYCDFSGYSDIARGLAKWMGYELPVNFDHPYIASSFREFWTRWHISLSTWFRDYVYIPLGGSRRGEWAGHGNMWITMIVSGVWHGASWTMVAWGMIHAVYLSLERLTNWPKRLKALPGGRATSTLLVFAMVVVAWVFFRAPYLGHALHVLAIMFNPMQLNVAAAREFVGDHHLLLLWLIMARQLWFYFGLDRIEWRLPRRMPVLEPVMMACVMWACVFLRGPGSEFIYFQF